MSEPESEPNMPILEARAKLADVLASLHPNNETALLMADRCGIDQATIKQLPRPRETWASVVEEAAKHGRLLKLVELAQRDFPNNDPLKALRRTLDVPVPPPPPPQPDPARDPAVPPPPPWSRRTVIGLGLAALAMLLNRGNSNEVLAKDTPYRCRKCGRREPKPTTDWTCP